MANGRRSKSRRMPRATWTYDEVGVIPAMTLTGRVRLGDIPAGPGVGRQMTRRLRCERLWPKVRQ